MCLNAADEWEEQNENQQLLEVKTSTETVRGIFAKMMSEMLLKLLISAVNMTVFKTA